MKAMIYRQPSCFCQENVRQKGKITYFPIYMVAFPERTQAEENVYKFDLTGLDHI